jgi:hypothetical protein
MDGYMDFVNPAKIKVKRTRIKPKIEYEKEIKLSLDKEQYELLLKQRFAVERQINFYFSYEGQTKNDTLRIRMVSKNLIVLTHKLHVGHQQEVRTSREKSVSLNINDAMEFIRSKDYSQGNYAQTAFNQFRCALSGCFLYLEKQNTHRGY